MAWEKRGKKGKRYFYRSRRTPDGRVVKDYLGKGAKARRVAREMHERKNYASALLTVEGEWLELIERTDDLDQMTTLLLEASLLLGGYHRSNYGPWRKRREQGRDSDDVPGTSPGIRDAGREGEKG
jgi:hypothetical protein